MIYYAPGATHSPHHPTPEWIEKISAMHLFDKGFAAVREQIFENQKKLGVIPEDAKLTPWPKDLLKTWDQHTPEEQKLLIKEADVYAAYLAYADHEIGRVVDAIDDMGKLDNTIIIYISGDNGASAEGSAMGTWNEVLPFNSINPSTAENMEFYDDWGNADTYPHYSIDWAWTLDTPYKWTKQIASYFGGTKNGMVISWPAKIKDKGGIRWQFHHVIDIVPTLLEIAGIPQPVQVDGVAQKPIEGVSLAYTLNAGPDVRRVRQVPGAAFGRLGGNALRCAASQPGGGPDGVRILGGNRPQHSRGEHAEPAQQVLHHHGRD